MAKDPISARFTRMFQLHQRDERVRRQKSKDELEAEEELIKKTEKVKPLHADEAPGRNDPCPCGSGKKFKKCCEGKSPKEIAKARNAVEAVQAKAEAEAKKSAKRTTKKAAKKTTKKKTAKTAKKSAKKAK